MNRDVKVSRRELFSLALGRLPALVPWEALEKVGGEMVRPPGSIEPAGFVLACRRCGHCAAACPPGIIQLAGAEAGSALGTPYLDFSKGGCDFCLKCAQACPGGALQVTEKSKPGIARIKRDACLGWNGMLCGECFYACPLAGKALYLEAGRYPVVQEGECNGCGSCEHRCLQNPSAIRVRPVRDKKSK